MCGIAGILGLSDKEKIEAQLCQMKDALRHRGPDGEGVWISGSGNLAFGHRRLSIIDLTKNAAQPMTSLDGRYVITYNGEIYNYRELREECEKRGSAFRSQSDTEVIIEAYRHWGVDSLTRFCGMWAFALYDSIERKLILSRDPFGIKPLYYGYLDGSLYFASEPKAMRAVSNEFGIPDDITIRLFEDCAYLDRGDWTFYKKIKRFPHAHFAVIDLDKGCFLLHFSRYWYPPTTMLKIDFQEAAEELRRLLIRSVHLHLRSDVPVGACLSGGLDSSSIVCIGSSFLPSGSQFNTFTTRYSEFPEIDETQWAGKVIRFVSARERYADPTFQSLMEDFDRLIYYQDEPYGSMSIYAQYNVFKEISKTEVKVILDGQGADEQLAGYHGFMAYYLEDLLSQGRWMAYLLEWNNLRKIYPYLFPNNFREQFQRLRKRLLHIPKAGYKGGREKPCADELENRLHEMRLPDDNFDQVLTNLTVETNLPQLLRYEDRNSMAFSIESRVPFLETELVNFTLSVPARLKIRKGLTKAVLREALKGIIPEDIRLRTDKLGFPAPDTIWMKQGFGIDTIGPGQIAWRKLIVEKWLETIQKGYSC